MSRSGVNYIPRPDGDFNGWANHYYDTVKDWWALQGFDENDLKPLELALTAWNTAFPAHVRAAAAAEAARQSKDAARGSLESEIRPVTRFVQGYIKTTDADRASMGITVRHGVVSASSRSAARTNRPTTRPLVRVDTSQRLLHTLRFSDESTPTRRRKPHGVLGAEVWVALAAAGEAAPLLRFAGIANGEERIANSNGGASASSPVRDSDPTYRFLAISTSGMLQTDFSTAEAGRTAYYALRWLSTRGETGPWSEIAAATVAA